jgi:hypothetical protein
MKKMSVFQELNELHCKLKFIKGDGSLDNDKWRTWKELHNILTDSWNVLLSQPLAPYFVKHLTNKGKLK